MHSCSYDWCSDAVYEGLQFSVRSKLSYDRYFLCSVSKFYFYFRQLLACRDS
jgi:hypothetical protein